MATLHLLRSSPFEQNQFQTVLNLIQENDGLVLMDDGVYALKHPLMAQAKTGIIYVIESHAVARNIVTPSHIKRVNSNGVIELTLNHQQSVTWQ